MPAPPPGSIARLLVRVDVVNPDGTGTITVLDDDGNPVGQPRAMPVKVMNALQPIAISVAVGDVLQNARGLTAVVRWVDEVDKTRWSPSLNRDPLHSTEGWSKIGTAAIT